MAKRKFEEILADLEGEAPDDLIQELRQFEGSKLRESAEKVPELERKLAEAEAKVTKLEAAPARQKAFEDYGIDFENLSKAERKILESYDGELDSDAIGELAEEFDLPTVQGAGQGEGEGAPESERQTQQALERGKRPGRLTISPADTEEWPHDKLMRFMEEHPDEYESLMRGDTVTGIAV